MARDQCVRCFKQSSSVGWLVKVTHSFIVCCVVSNGLRLEPVRFLSSQQKDHLNSAVANEDKRKMNICPRSSGMR